MMRIDYELSLEDVLAHPRFMLRQSFLFKPYAFIAAPVLGFFLSQWSPSTHTYYGPQGTVTEPFLGFWFDFAIWTVLSIGLILLMRGSYNRRIKENLTLDTDLWKGAHSLIIDTAKVVSIAQHSRSEIDLTIIKKVEEGPNHIFIFYSKDAAWTIPKRFLPPDVDTLRLRAALLPGQRSSS
ncbi:MAG: YcxB family protein [Flavobacteriales bacterium]